MGLLAAIKNWKSCYKSKFFSGQTTKATREHVKKTWILSGPPPTQPLKMQFFSQNKKKCLECS